MAKTMQLVVNEANALADLCNRMATLLADVQHALTHNSNQAIDWAAVSLPAYITEDAAGNITGLLYGRAAVANAIGTLSQFVNLMTNLPASQGDHVGNLNQLARPLG